MEHKLFTLGEASALLPELKEDLHNLQQLVREFEEGYSRLKQLKVEHMQAGYPVETERDPYFEVEGKLDFLRFEADLRIKNFERRGVLLKNINPGLIDFPAMLNGEPVLICWKEGEEQITHYHGWNDGYIGRKPIGDA